MTLIDRSLESVPTNVTEDVVKSVTMKTLDAWLLQIGHPKIRGMKRSEKENKLLLTVCSNDGDNQNVIHNEKEPSPNVDSVNDNDISESEEGEEKTEDLLKEVFDHVRKKLKRDDIARDQIKFAVEYTLQHVYMRELSDEEKDMTSRENDVSLSIGGHNEGQEKVMFSFNRLHPHEANSVLLSLKKPKLFTDKKESFSTTFKTFQVGFARHCALIECACDDVGTNASLTLKKLTSMHGQMEIVNLLEDDSSDSEGHNVEIHDSNKGKELYDLYKKHLKTISKGVFDPMGKPLLDTLRKEGLSYKPKQFVTLMRQKKKKGLWKDSEGYNSDKLYEPFYIICQKLNLFHEE